MTALISKTKKQVSKTTSAMTKKQVGDFANVLIRPLVSEKGTAQQADNKYYFEVARDVNKIQIRNAIEALYKVNVVSVRVLNQRGKSVRFGKFTGARKAWKKAIVTLQKGQRITTVEGV